MNRPALQLTQYDPPDEKPGRARPACNDACIYARGALCECKCLGANHGVGHVIASNQELFEFAPLESAPSATTQAGQ